ncbi:MAG TPA: hypothetical protein VIR60_01530 [Gammaproteobacteria bacterium]
MREHETETSSTSTFPGGDGAAGTSARDEVQRQQERARRTAGNLQQQAAERGTQMLEERKGWVTGEVDAVAQALHRSAEELAAERSQAAPYAHAAADALDRLSEHLHRKDAKTLLRETQEFARREPGLVIGGALALGFALTRFLKSSEARPDPHQDPHQDPHREPAGGGYPSSGD